MKFKKIIIPYLLCSFCMISSSFAIELQETPIQTELSNSILLAADNWDIDDNSTTKSTKNNNPAVEKQHKSVVKAGLYSALLPGLGEHYVGHKTKAKIFFAAEVTTWLSYIALHTYGNWKKDDMIQIANEKAGAALEGKSDEFNDWVGYYGSSDEFNSLGRVSDPDRVYLSQEDEYWQWSSEADQEAYRTYKNSSRDAYRQADFMIVAAVASRIISIIDAVRDAKRHNRTEKIEIGNIDSYNYHFGFDPLSRDKQFTLTLFTPF